MTGALVQTGFVALESGAATDTGCIRDHNEDSHVVIAEAGLWVVADGMGGHDAGDFASQAITGAMRSLGVPGSLDDLRARFMDRLTQAHNQILAHSETLGGSTVGATLAAFLLFEDDCACIWSGDSRIYRARDGKLEQLTRDHTEVGELLLRGMITPAQAAVWPRRNVITRAIGVTTEPECDISNGKMEIGDLFLLCSDGLTEHSTDQEIAAILTGPGTAQDICDALIAQTLARGAKDNVTAVMLRCHPPAPPTFDDED